MVLAEKCKYFRGRGSRGWVGERKEGFSITCWKIVTTIARKIGAAEQILSLGMWHVRVRHLPFVPHNISDVEVQLY